jgi:PD-(D/E)XK nuclease superfamily
MGLVSKGRPADQLWFGTGVHLALAEYYGIPGFKRGPHPADTFDAWVGHEVRQIKASAEEWHDEDEYANARDLGVNMLTKYVDFYGTDPDIEMIAVEQPFAIDIEVGGIIVATFAGTFDGVHIDHSEDPPRAYLWEHKTAAQISTAYLSLDDQAGGYFAVADETLHAQGLLTAKQHIAGVQYNFLRKNKPDCRPQNKRGMYLNQDGTVSKKQPAPMFYREVQERNPGEVQSQLRRLTSEVEIMDGMRSGELPIIKNTNWNCPRCPFFEMCQLHEKGGTSWKAFMRTAYTVRDPYQDHRKSAAE